MDYQRIKVKQLGAYLREYNFGIRTDNSGIYIDIPGHGGGRDGPTIADYPEQEEWMRKHSGLKEVWHLTWECQDERELKEFVKKIEASKA